MSYSRKAVEILPACLGRHYFWLLQWQVHRQEHSENDKKYLGEYHHSGKQEYENRYPQIEDKQEEHHSQTVYDLRYRQIVVVVVLNLCFHDFLSGLVVLVGRVG